MMISSGALGAGLGALSASSTHYTASGQNVENSATAQGVSTGMSAAIGGISSALGVLGPWGAVAGLITQVLGSGLTSLITQWIDADRDARNERVETANSILKTLDQINSNTAELKDFVKTNDWSYDSTQAWKEQISELRKSFGLEENQKAAEQIWQNLLNNNGGGKSLEFNGIEYYSLDAFLRALGQSSGDIADQGFAMFTKAQNQTERTNQVGAQENNVYNLSNEYTDSIIETLKNRQLELAHELYEDDIQDLGPLTVSDEAMLSSAIDSLKYDNKISREFYEALLAYLKSNNSGLDQDILKELEVLQKDYTNQLAEYYSDYNEGIVNEAVQNAVGFNGTRLLDMSEWNLSKMSPDEIIQAVTDAVLKEGSFMGIDVNSQKGQQLIESIIKENETLYNAMTGKSYTLSEAFDLEDNEEILRQFATALNVPMSELDRMRELVGDIKLGDLVEGLESLRESASELSDLLDEIASKGGLSNESIESIVKNLPSLVPYLDDTAKLVEELLKQSSQYNISYGTAMWGEISSSQGLYKEFLDSLGATNLGAKDKLLGDLSPFKQADSIQPLLAFLGALQNSPLEEVNKEYGFDFTEQEVADILKVYTEKYTTTFKDIITETLVSIPQKMIDTLLEKQLDNLNAQKEALQSINDEREYENKLIEAKLKLENAQTEKRRVWREGVGWTYESDQSAIKEAQENLESVTNENKISELDRQIAETQALKDQNASIQDEQAFEQLAQAFAGWQDSFDSAIGADGLFGQMKDNLGTLVDFIKGLQAGSFSIKVDAGEQADNETIKKEEDLSSLKEEAAKLQKMQAGLATPSGMTDEQWHASDEYKQKESEYNKAVSDYQKHWDTHNKQYGDEDYNDWSTSTDATESFGYNLDQQGSSALLDQGIETLEYNGQKLHVKPENLAGLNPNAKIHTPYWDVDKSASNNKDMQYVAPFPTNGGSIQWENVPDSVIEATDGPQGPYKLINYMASQSKYSSGGLITVSNGTPGSNLKADQIGLVAMGNSADSDYEWASYPRGIYGLEALAKGTLRARGGGSLINEVGTEAIVTPQGTITSLPSGAGVLPADLTKNLYDLGGVAPELLRFLEPVMNTFSNFSSGGYGNTDNSLNINTVNMNVTADSSFNVDEFINNLRTATSLSKNNRR